MGCIWLIVRKDLREGMAINLSSGDMAEGNDDLESLLCREREQERSYHWLEAAVSNEKLLTLSDNQGTLKKGESLDFAIIMLFIFDCI